MTKGYCNCEEIIDEVTFTQFGMCEECMTKKEMFERWNMTDHGDKPKLLEYDPKNDIVDVFVYRRYECPYPYTITNTRDDEDIWTHQGFYLKHFIMDLRLFFERHNLPYKVIDL